MAGCGLAGDKNHNFDKNENNIPTITETEYGDLVRCERGKNSKLHVVIGALIDISTVGSVMDISYERGRAIPTKLCKGFSRTIIFSNFSRLIMGARKMEDIAEIVRAITREMEQSKTELQSLANDVNALADVINPKLLDHIRKIRESRMTVIREVHESLTALRDLRKFFLEADYDKEVSRLERLVSLCKDLQVLKREGTLDAVLDSAIHLACQGDNLHERKSPTPGTSNKRD